MRVHTKGPLCSTIGRSAEASINYASVDAATDVDMADRSSKTSAPRRDRSPYRTGGATRRGDYIAAVSFEEAAGFVARNNTQGSEACLFFEV